MKNFKKIVNLILLSTILFGLFGIISHSATTSIVHRSANQPIENNGHHIFQSANLLGVFFGNEHQHRANQQLPTNNAKHESNSFHDNHLASTIDNKIFFIKLVYYTRYVLLFFHTYDIIYPFHFYL